MILPFPTFTKSNNICVRIVIILLEIVRHFENYVNNIMKTFTTDVISSCSNKKKIPKLECNLILFSKPKTF
jgi:hypothetical protein